MIEKKYSDNNNIMIKEEDIEKYQKFYAFYEWEGVKCKEIHSNQKILMIDYYIEKKDFSKIKIYHLNHYPDSDYCVLLNKSIYYYDNQGNFLYLKIEVDRENIYCEAEYDINGLLCLGQVHYFKEIEKKDLLYAFEYGKDKFIFNCYSFQESENVRIDTLDKEIVDEVLKILEDVQLQVEL